MNTISIPVFGIAHFYTSSKGRCMCVFPYGKGLRRFAPEVEKSTYKKGGQSCQKEKLQSKN